MWTNSEDSLLNEKSILKGIQCVDGIILEWNTGWEKEFPFTFGFFSFFPFSFTF